jgi:dihydroneopterin aldolase
MDRLSLVTELSCLVGILPRERVEPQPIRVSLALDLDLERVGETGDLAAGVDYAEVDALVRFLAVEGRFRLIESLAIAILRALLTAPVARARVRIEKPTVMRAALPAVELERGLDWVRADDVLVDVPEVRAVRGDVPGASSMAFRGATISVQRRQ